MTAGTVALPTGNGVNTPASVSAAINGALGALEINLGRIGWRGDGGAADLALVNSVYGEAPHGAIIHIPGGVWPGDPTVSFGPPLVAGQPAPQSYYSAKSVTWWADGPLTDAGGNTILQIGDGDTFISSHDGSIYASKLYSTSLYGGGAGGGYASSCAVDTAVVTNDNPFFATNYATIFARQTTMIVSARGTGDSFSLVGNLISHGTNGPENQGVGVVGNATSYGDSYAACFAGAFNSLSGQKAGGFNNLLSELDAMTNVPAVGGDRIGHYVTNNAKQWPGWPAFTVVAPAGNLTAPKVIQEIPANSSEPHVFRCIAGGMTGGAKPVFVAGNSTQGQTVVDGETVQWEWCGPVRTSWDVYEYIAGNGAFNRLHEFAQTFYSHVYNTTACTLPGNAVAVNLSAGHVINLAGRPQPAAWKGGYTLYGGTFSDGTVDNRCIPTDHQGVIYLATLAPGQTELLTGGYEPPWPNTLTGTVRDGTILWVPDSSGAKLKYDPVAGAVTLSLNSTGMLADTVLAAQFGNSGGLTLAGGIGMFGKAPPATAPVLTGAKQGNPLFASIVAALAALGCQDQTTA